MGKSIFVVLCLVSGIVFLPNAVAQETITLSTYYPAPCGEYESLSVGSGYSAPTNDGDLLVEGNVGIGTTTPGARLDVSGGIKSTMWNVSKPITYSGAALPRSGTFTSNGGTLMIFASATAYRATAGNMRVDVTLGGVVRGSLRAYTNEVSSHKTLSPDVIVLTGIGAGSHTVGLVLVDGLTDVNDYSQVTVLELPF